MLQAGTARLADQVSASGIAPKYKRHRPEQTLLFHFLKTARAQEVAIKQASEISETRQVSSVNKLGQHKHSGKHRSNSKPRYKSQQGRKPNKCDASPQDYIGT